MIQLEYLHDDVRINDDGKIEINKLSPMGELASAIGCWLREASGLYHKFTTDELADIMDQMILAYINTVKRIEEEKNNDR